MLRSVATGGSESFYAPPAYALLAQVSPEDTGPRHVDPPGGALHRHHDQRLLVGGYIAKNWGWRSVFYVYGGAGILIGLVFVFPPERRARLRATGETQNRRPRSPKWENPLRSLSIIFRTPTALLLTTGFTAVVFVNNAYVVFAPGVSRGASSACPKGCAGTYAMFFHHLAALVGVLIGGPLSDRLCPAGRGRAAENPDGHHVSGRAGDSLHELGRHSGAACAGMALFGLFRGLYRVEHPRLAVRSHRAEVPFVGGGGHGDDRRS